MKRAIKNWWQQMLIAADEATTRSKRVLGSTSNFTETHRSLQLSQLEPRVLFSASPVEPGMITGIEVTSTVAEMEPIDLPSDSAEPTARQHWSDQTARELIIFDSSVPDIQQLLDDLGRSGRDAEIFVLDAGRDGIDQISEILDSRSDVNSIHIVSHARLGAVRLGNVWLDESNLDGYAGQIASWQGALSTDADILFYGCDLAGNASGVALIESIGALSGADVAASDDDTGGAILGGDWELEYATSTIETEVAFSLQAQQSWGHLLNVAVDATSTGTTADQSSVTVQHTTSGTNRLMLVSVATDPHGEIVSSVSYGGNSLTLVGATEDPSNHSRAEIWALVAPQTGVGDVVVTLTGGGHKGVSVGVMTLTGVNQANPFYGYTGATGSSATASATLSSALDDVVFSVVHSHNGSSAEPGPGQTEYWDDVVDQTNSSGTLSQGGPSVTTSWTVDDDDWTVAALAVQADTNSISRVSLVATQDSYIQASNPTTNSGASPLITVDREDSDLQRALVQFDLSTLPAGANIVNAKLKLEAVATGGTLTIDVHRLLESWDESTTTWNESSLGTNWSTAGGVFDPSLADTVSATSTGQYEWDITNLARDWVDGTSQNFGVLLGSFEGGGNRDFSFDSREGATAPVLEVVYSVTSTPPLEDTLWFSTNGDVSTPSGVSGLDAWSNGSAIYLDDPNLTLGSGATDGTVDGFLNFDHFVDDGNVSVDALHYVTSNITVGGANAIDLQVGDILFSTAADEGFNAGGLSVGKADIALFRPDVAGDYRSGTFSILLDDLGGSGSFSQVYSISLVEQTTTFGDTTLQAGDFLFSRFVAFGANDVVLYETTGVGEGTTSGTSTKLIEGDDLGLHWSSSFLFGMDLIEEQTVVGGETINAGTLLLTSTGTFSGVGSGSIDTTQHDVFAVEVSETTMVGGTTVGDASILIRGSDLGFNSNDMRLDALALGVQAINLSPTDISLAPVSVDENTNSNSGVTVGTLTATDPDSGELFAYSILGGADQANFTIGGANGDELILTDGFLDFESKPTYSVTVRVTDSALDVYDETLAVSINDLTDVLVVDTTSDVSDGTTTSIASLLANRGADGRISLREAIEATNNDTGSTTPDEIHFQILDALASGVHTIQVASGGLPALTDVVVIDGTTESDYAGTPVVVLDGTNAGVASGLTILAGSDGTTITGLVIKQFAEHGVLIDGSSSNTISGNSIFANAGVGIQLNSGNDGRAAATLSSVVTDGSSSVTITGSYSDPALSNETLRIEYFKSTASAQQGEVFIGSHDVATDASGSLVINHTLAAMVATGEYVTATVTDSIGNTSPFSLPVQAPLANTEEVLVVNPLTIDEGATELITPLLLETTDAEQGATQLTYVITSGPANGALRRLGTALVATNTFTQDDIDSGRIAYEHAGSETTSDSFVFTVDDGFGSQTNGTFSITVVPVNDNSPIADAESFTVVEGGSVTEADLDSGTTLLDGDTDADLPSDTLTVETTPDSGPSHGTLTLNTDGTFDYTHDGSENYNDSFTYRVRDTANNFAIGTVSITVTSVNDAPVVANAIADQTATQGLAFSFQFANNVFDDAEGDTLSYTVTRSDASLVPGWLGFDSASRTFSGTPGDADVGAITVRITADDGNLGTEFVDFDITVNEVNDAPTVSLTPVVVALSEDTDTTLPILIASIAVHDDAIGVNTLSLAGVDTSLFEIVGTDLMLRANVGLDFEADPSFDVRVNVDDASIAGSPEDFEMYVVSITDANEAPTAIMLENRTVASGEAAAVVGEIEVSDPDTGDSHSWSIDDSRFEIVNERLRLKAGVRLDFETTPIVSLVVTATDQAGTGLSVTETFLVTVDKPQDAFVSRFVVLDLPGPLELSLDEDESKSDTESESETETESKDETGGESSSDSSVGVQPIGVARANSATINRQVSDPLIAPHTEFSVVTDFSLDQNVMESKTTKEEPREKDRLTRPTPVETAAIIPIARLVVSDDLISVLNTLHEEVSGHDSHRMMMVGSTATVGTTLSVGYVIWLIRGGVLVSSVLSSLPAWQSIDPLPILGYDDDGADNADDSLESMVENSNAAGSSEDKS